MRLLAWILGRSVQRVIRDIDRSAELIQQEHLILQGKNRCHVCETVYTMRAASDDQNVCPECAVELGVGDTREEVTE